MSFAQATRPLQVETVLGSDVLLVTGLTGEEEMSRPFHFTVRLSSEDRLLNAASLIGTPVCVSVTTPSGGTRLIHGLVRRFRNIGRGAGTGALALTAYEAELVPWFWMLTLSTDCRIFQHLTVPEIVTQVFRDLGHHDFTLRLTRKYSPREYCVQYRETHFAFVSRLLEDEGIAYHFEHADDKHTLVLTDGSVSVPPCPDLPAIRPDRQVGRTGEIRVEGGRPGSTRPGFPQPGVTSPGFVAPRIDAVGMSPVAAMPEGDGYTALVVEQAVHTRAVALADYDYLKPTVPLAGSSAAEDGLGEAFDYPGKFTESAEGDWYARLRIEAIEAQRETATGVGAAPGLTSGYKITVEGDGLGAKKRAWLVVRVTHEAQQALGSGIGAGDGAAPFSCETRFTLASLEVPWRPPLVTPRPRVDGTQSALVVGPAGQEIWTDAQGRVKLHFYWDRRSKKDENSSCWVRCSTAWAGRGYGQFSVPRMGQEVLVDFLEGDPDRPVVVGRVYNADQPPPGHAGGGGALGVLSGLQSKTHKGSGANSMTMDDTAGKEKIAIHAQYDMTTDVGHDDTQTVANDRKITVGAKHTETIASDTTIKVTGGPYSLDVAGGTSTVHVSGAVKENYDATQDTTVAGQITTKSTGAAVDISAATEIKLHVGGASITLKADGTILINGKAIAITGTESIAASAPSVDATGTQEVTIGVGGQAVSCDPGKVAISGAMINASASGVHEISGGLVKIN